METDNTWEKMYCNTCLSYNFSDRFSIFSFEIIRIFIIGISYQKNYVIILNKQNYILLKNNISRYYYTYINHFFIIKLSY